MVVCKTRISSNIFTDYKQHNAGNEMVPISIEMNGRTVIVQVCTLRHLLLLFLLLLHLAYLLVALALGLEPLLYGG